MTTTPTHATTRRVMPATSSAPVNASLTLTPAAPAGARSTATPRTTAGSTRARRRGWRPRSARRSSQAQRVDGVRVGPGDELVDQHQPAVGVDADHVRV